MAVGFSCSIIARTCADRMPLCFPHSLIPSSPVSGPYKPFTQWMTNSFLFSWLSPRVLLPPGEWSLPLHPPRQRRGEEWLLTTLLHLVRKLWKGTLILEDEKLFLNGWVNWSTWKDISLAVLMLANCSAARRKALGVLGYVHAVPDSFCAGAKTGEGFCSHTTTVISAWFL